MNNDPQVEQFRAAAQAGNPAAQFNLGLWHLRQPGAGPFPAAARGWFEKAAASGFAPAQTMLGRMHLGFPGGQRDADAARDCFMQAAEQAFPEACYQLAELSVALGDEAGRYTEARQWLERAVELQHAPAYCQLAYLLDEGIGGRADPLKAIDLYKRAAAAGVARGWNQIAHYFEVGQGFRQDGERALSAYQRAAAKKYPAADDAVARLWAQLSAEERDRAGSLTDEVILAPSPAAARCTNRPECRPEVLSEGPRIALLHDLFTATECQHLIATARPFLEPSRVVSEEGRNVKDDKRTSWEMRFYPESKDMLVWIYERRLARISETRPEQGEPLMILRYEPGQEYQTHVDYFDVSLPGQRALVEANGQRMLTMLTYLSTVEAGGGTEFPELDLVVAPEPGATLAFYNVTAEGQPDPRSLHAGLPVEKGTKWLATRWVRDRDWRSTR